MLGTGGSGGDEDDDDAAYGMTVWLFCWVGCALCFVLCLEPKGWRGGGARNDTAHKRQQQCSARQISGFRARSVDKSQSGFFRQVEPRGADVWCEQRSERL